MSASGKARLPIKVATNVHELHARKLVSLLNLRVETIAQAALGSN